MPSMQIVFLFDLNAYIDDHNEFDLNRKLLCLRLTCLRILTYYFAIEPNLKWGFKFFDSRGSPTQIMSKFSFSEVSLESFETLENEITVRYQRHLAYLSALSVSVLKHNLSPSDKTNKSKINTSHPTQVLQLALTQILCEFQWSSQLSIFSPVKRNQYCKNAMKNDLLFLVTKCPKKAQHFSEYFGADLSLLTSGKFVKALLTPSLHEQLLQKSSIRWVWLDTNGGNFLNSHTEEILSKIADLLKSIDCSLIPVSVFSHPPHVFKYERSLNQAIKHDLINSFIPFSKIIPQSLSYEFYLHSKSKPGEAVLHFQSRELYVHLVEICDNREDSKLHSWNTIQNENEKELAEKAKSLTWSKFFFHFALPKTSYPHLHTSSICFPAVYGNDENYSQFQQINENLILSDSNMFIVCESSCGIKLPGLFSSLSATSGLITIMNPERLSETITMPLNFLIPDCVKNANGIPGSNNLKPFQIECLNPWFTPSNSLKAILPEKEHQNKSLKSFYKKVSQKYSKQPKPTPEKENIAPENVSEAEQCFQSSEVYDASNITYDELINLLNVEYEYALKPGHSLLQSARKIVKTTFSFFELNPTESRSVETALKDFLKEFFTVSYKKINEKYDQSADNCERIQECKLQVLIALETEILSPHSDRLDLIKNMTTYLRCMTFFSAEKELNDFLPNILKKNYENTLHDVLVEISDELDIPLFEVEEDSSFDQSEPPSSESMFGSNSSRVPSVLSAKSSSSSSLGTGNKKLASRRSDIMDNSKNPQILLTKSSPKKKKYKNLVPGAENIPIRYSPRLSSKRRKERNMNCSKNASHVRRNLFPKDQKPSTPKYSSSPYKKKKLRTPKHHHVLKTSFVPETPTAKQNLSALQRRKSFMDTDDSEISLTELAESPRIDKSAKNPDRCELLKKLTSLESKPAVLPLHQTMPSCSSYSRYTPESKRRLSLKLFSDHFTSPTSRLGLKKCSKRLFDQVSPQTDNGTYKKPKLDVLLEDMSVEKQVISDGSKEKTPKKRES